MKRFILLIALMSFSISSYAIDRAAAYQACKVEEAVARAWSSTAFTNISCQPFEDNGSTGTYKLYDLGGWYYDNVGGPWPWSVLCDNGGTFNSSNQCELTDPEIPPSATTAMTIEQLSQVLMVLAECLMFGLGFIAGYRR